MLESLFVYVLSGALNEALLETPYNEVEICQTEGACLSSHTTAFPGKLKEGVHHSQEDGTNILPSQLHNMSELCAFHHKHL